MRNVILRRRREQYIVGQRQEYLYSPDPVRQALAASGESYNSDGSVLLLDLHPVSPEKITVAGQPSAVIRATLPVAARQSLSSKSFMSITLPNQHRDF